MKGMLVCDDWLSLKLTWGLNNVMLFFEDFPSEKKEEKSCRIHQKQGCQKVLHRKTVNTTCPNSMGAFMVPIQNLKWIWCYIWKIWGVRFINWWGPLLVLSRTHIITWNAHILIGAIRFTHTNFSNLPHYFEYTCMTTVTKCTLPKKHYGSVVATCIRRWTYL
jgi:hypothetical protein